MVWRSAGRTDQWRSPPLGQCRGRRCQEFVVIAVDLVLPEGEQACGTPVQEEGQGGKKIRVRNGMRHRRLLGLDVFEIRQTLQIGPQVLPRQIPL